MMTIGCPHEFRHCSRESSFADSRLNNFDLKSLQPVLGPSEHFLEQRLCSSHKPLSLHARANTLFEATQTCPCDRFLSLPTYLVHVINPSASRRSARTFAVVQDEDG